MKCIDDPAQDAKMNYILIILWRSCCVSLRTIASLKHFMVLDAIARGFRTIEKICKVTRLDENEVKLIINDLIKQRLIISKGDLSVKK
jgi:hypothetical protein